MIGNNPRTVLETLNRLERERIASPAATRRQFDRHIVRGDAELAPLGDRRLEEIPVRVQLRDVGLGGVGFVSNRPWKPTSLWQMSFIAAGFVSSTHAVLIRHCNLVRDDIYLVGAQFVLNPAALIGLGVDPAKLRAETSGNEDDNAAFLAPGDMM